MVGIRSQWIGNKTAQWWYQNDGTVPVIDKSEEMTTKLPLAMIYKQICTGCKKLIITTLNQG